MKVENRDILEYVFRGKATAVQPQLAFEEMEACIAIGITYEKYQSLPGSSIWLDAQTAMSKCDVLIWYRYHKLYPLVLEDIAAHRPGRK